MKKVISMSRRTDMRWFANQLIPVLLTAHPPSKVHTAVCWTKFPGCITSEPYAEVLKRYDQLFVHVTITGLGGSPIEPNVPQWEQALKELSGLIKFLETPRRIRLRIDPLVVVKSGKQIISNITMAELIIARAAVMGITAFTTSFMDEYPKVKQRMAQKGYEIITLSQDQRAKIITRLAALAEKHGGKLYTCAEPGFQSSKCIDGALLRELHPDNEPCIAAKDKSQRSSCACTTSYDIGAYDMVCKSGCMYCYANAQ